MSDYLDTGNARLLEDSVAEARQLADVLVSHAASLCSSHVPAGALDEVYRSAHSLRAEAEAAGMGSVAQLAGLIRDAAQGMRERGVGEGPAMLLAEAARSAARAARDGGEADFAAANALVGGLRGLPARVPSPREARRTLRVQRGRVEAVIRAAAEAERMAAELIAGARTPPALLGEAREAAAQFHVALSTAAAEMPAILESLRAGAAATEVAGALMERFSAAETIIARMEDGLAAAARQASDAASACAGAAREVRDAVARVRLVPVGLVFRSVGRRLGPRVAVESSGQDIEVDSSLLDPLRAALIGLASSRLQEKTRSRAVTRLSLSARRQDDWVLITISGGRSKRTRAALEARRQAGEGLAGVGGKVGGITEIEVRVPIVPGTMRCLLVRAAGHWFGIPGSAVVECVNLRRGATVTRGGKALLPVMLESILSPSAPRTGAGQPDLAAVIVRSGRRSACLVGDAHGGVRSVMLSETGSPRPPCVVGSGAAEDGSPVSVLDVACLVKGGMRK